MPTASCANVRRRPPTSCSPRRASPRERSEAEIDGARRAAAEAAALHQATLAHWEAASAAEQAERDRLAAELAAREAAWQTTQSQLAHLERQADDVGSAFVSSWTPRSSSASA